MESAADKAFRTSSAFLLLARNSEEAFGLGAVDSPSSDQEVETPVCVGVEGTGLQMADGCSQGSGGSSLLATATRCLGWKGATRRFPGIHFHRIIICRGATRRMRRRSRDTRPATFCNSR